MLNVAIALAAIPVGAISLPRNFKYGGQEAATARLSALEAAKGEIKRLGKEKKLSQEKVVSLLADVKLLHRANDDGWGRWKDWGAVTRIVKELGGYGAESAVTEIKRQATSVGEGLRTVGDKIGEGAKDLGRRAGKVVEEIRERSGL